MEVVDRVCEAGYGGTGDAEGTDTMDRDGVAADLRQAGDKFINELWAWRTAHPTATFAEIEVALAERLDQLRARVLPDLAVAGQATGGAETPEAERPVCSECGVPLQPRGTRTRHLTIQGNHPLLLTRTYWVCPACGAGLFPPG